MINLPVVLRDPIEADRNIILSSWLKSYRNSAFATHIPNDVYFYMHNKIIERLLQSGRVVIIGIKDDLGQVDYTQVLGYLIYEQRDNLFIIHFCYVKFPYRKLGLMRHAITEVLKSNDNPNIIFITHLPRAYEKLKQKYPYVYNPYLLENQ